MADDTISTKDLLLAMHENTVVSRNIMSEVRHLADALSSRRAEDAKGVGAKTCISMISAAFSVLLVLTYFVNDRITEVSENSNNRIERVENRLDKRLEREAL